MTKPVFQGSKQCGLYLMNIPYRNKAKAHSYEDEDK